MGTLMPVLDRKDLRPRPQAIRGRKVFVQLRQSRRRAWSGPVRIQFLPTEETDEARRVAFALPRKLGTAVERNRLRRRLRVVVAEATAFVPAGRYLVGIVKGFRDVPYQELRTRVIDAMQRASEAASR